MYDDIDTADLAALADATPAAYPRGDVDSMFRPGDGDNRRIHRTRGSRSYARRVAVAESLGTRRP